jgi:hypothetical protein
VLELGLTNVNFDGVLNSIFNLKFLTNLKLSWCRISLENVKSSLSKRGRMPRLNSLHVYDSRSNRSAPASFYAQPPTIEDADVLEICSYFPALNVWSTNCLGPSLTVDGVRELKRICPQIYNVVVGELSTEVKEELTELKIRFSPRRVIVLDD